MHPTLVFPYLFLATCKLIIIVGSGSQSNRFLRSTFGRLPDFWNSEGAVNHLKVQIRLCWNEPGKYTTVDQVLPQESKGKSGQCAWAYCLQARQTLSDNDIKYESVSIQHRETLAANSKFCISSCLMSSCFHRSNIWYTHQLKKSSGLMVTECKIPQSVASSGEAYYTTLLIWFIESSSPLSMFAWNDSDWSLDWEDAYIRHDQRVQNCITCLE